MLRIVAMRLVPCLFAMNAYARLVPHYHYAERTQAVPTVSRTDVPCTSAAEYTTYVGVREPAALTQMNVKVGSSFGEVKDRNGGSLYVPIYVG